MVAFIRLKRRRWTSVWPPRKPKLRPRPKLTPKRRPRQRRKPKRKRQQTLSARRQLRLSLLLPLAQRPPRLSRRFLQNEEPRATKVGSLIGPQSGRGQPHSKTLREVQRASCFRE